MLHETTYAAGWGTPTRAIEFDAPELAMTITAAPSAAASDLVQTINYLLDDVLGFDQTNQLISLTATRTGGSGNGDLVISVNGALGPLSTEVVEFFSFAVDSRKLLKDPLYAIEIEKTIRDELTTFVTGYVNRIAEGVDGPERALVVGATDALQNLLAAEIVKPLSSLLASSLADLNLPGRNAIVDILGDGFDKLGETFFKDFLPGITKTYAKMGLAEILTITTSDLDSSLATAINNLGNGVVGQVLDNILTNYFAEEGASPVDILDNVNFSDKLGRVLSELLIDFHAIDQEFIDDVLGLDGSNWIEDQIAGVLSSGIRSFIDQKFVDAIDFLGGDFDAFDLDEIFSDFAGSFDIAGLLTNIFGQLDPTDLAELFIDIDSLPEALAVQLGEWVGSKVLTGVIQDVALDVLTGLFGDFTLNAIGGAIFKGLGGLLGAGIGAIAGSVVFELLDYVTDGWLSDVINKVYDWIKNDSPQAFYEARFNAEAGEFIDGGSYSKDSERELREAVQDLRNAFKDKLNQVIDFIGEPATITGGYDSIYMVWGKKHYSSSFAYFIGSNENLRMYQSRDAAAVVMDAIGGTLRHMNFSQGDTTIALAYEQWKGDLISVGASNAAFMSTDAFVDLQSIIGLARFANAYRQDPTEFDALMASDAPIGVTVMQQFLEAELRGFNAPKVLHGSDGDGHTVGSAAAGDTIYLDGTATRAIARGGDDTVYGSAQNDIVSGGTGNDRLHGNAGNDAINGDEGNDIISGGDGDDTLSGDEGIDTASYAEATAGVTVNLSLTDVQNTRGAGSDTLSGFENLIGSTFNDTLTGSSLANVLNGGAGNDILQGLAGDDILIGGAGNDLNDGGSGIDTLDYSMIGSGVTINLISQSAQNTGGAGIDTIRNVENVIGTAFDDVLTGSSAGNLLSGGSGNDMLSGGLGDDRLDGGAGNDTANYATAASGVRVDLSIGTAQLTGGAGRDVLSSIENLNGSSFDDIFIGDAGNNLLVGNAGDDTLTGGLGDDTLNGGAGSDTASYASAEIGVIVNLAQTGPQSSGGAGIDTLISIENLIGSALKDTLLGNAQSNQINGGDGDDFIDGASSDDILDGGAGNDTLQGGNGDDRLNGGAGNDLIRGDQGNDNIDGSFGIDTLDYSMIGAGVTINLIIQSVQNTGGAGSDRIRNIENVIGTAFADSLTGNEFGNVLDGGRGDDTLVGGVGNDTLIGGVGIDIADYGSAGAGVRVNLNLMTAQTTVGAGTDTLSGIENLNGSGFDDQFTGDDANNVLIGNGGNDLLIGGGGNDSLNGGQGSDTASYASATAAVTVNLMVTTAQNTGGAGVDTLQFMENLTGSNYDDVLTGNAQLNTLIGGQGNDTLDGGSANDTLEGGNGNDILIGGAGNDVLIGGSGRDTLTGGAGNDRFVYQSAIQSAANANADRITDFALGDILDLSAVDASTGRAGDQAFVRVSAFTGVAGQLTLAFDAASNTTTLRGDADGNGAADFSILFTGNVATAITANWVL